MAAPVLSPKTTLEKLREIQRWGDSYTPKQDSPDATAPDYCLGAARFTLGKLVGLFEPEQHLDGFLDARTVDLNAGRVKAAWGMFSSPKHPDWDCKADFNGVVLPAAVRWGKKQVSLANRIEYASCFGNAVVGDQLLSQSTPIVVGVSIHGTGTRDHFIVLTPDKNGTIWAIDSWGNWTTGSVVALPEGSTLKEGIRVRLNAGTTVIPCAKPYVGWYRTKEKKAPLGLKLAL